MDSGINTFQKLKVSDARRLEAVTGRKYPFGNQIKTTLDALPPQLNLSIAPKSCPAGGKMEFLVTLERIDGCVAKHFAHLVRQIQCHDLEAYNMQVTRKPKHYVLLLGCGL